MCSISVDVDTLEDYVVGYGYKDKSIPCNNRIYTRALPRLLELFDSFNIKATFFIVGRDIKNPQNVPILRNLIKQGHEIGNHTMNHIYPFSRLSRAKKKEEILSAQKLAEDNLGYRVKGFRAPGYGIDEESLQILQEEDYVYDSSVHPTFLMSLLNMSVIFISGGKNKFPEMKNCLHCLSPLSPYTPRKNLFFKKGNDMRILEIPITVIPYFRMPFYGTFHLLFGKKVFDFGYYFLKKNGANINYAMHAIEMLGLMEDDLDKWFARQPGINISLAQKQKGYRHIFYQFKQDFEFAPLIDFSKRATDHA
ncbi:MAG: hypothetical protein AMJ78_04415 [Omnitrophica WOR_2 bacterium SM23_29]|nr:MAG: hypothetical protein AMJ78_04415 [Omnitrophica WOR_2 bacterium SM23_29]